MVAVVVGRGLWHLPILVVESGPVLAVAAVEDRGPTVGSMVVMAAVVEGRSDPQSPAAKNQRLSAG